MASYLRTGTHLAFAPLRATHSILSATYGLVSRTSTEARSVVSGGLAFLRRDRTAPAAALVGLGPLLLGVIKDPQTEAALKELLQLLADALAVLQREEVQQVTAQSLSLLASKPVTELVKHASTTVLSLVRVLQTPAVDKVRVQLELYFSYLLSTEAAAAAATDPASSAAHAWAHASRPMSSTSASSSLAVPSSSGDAVSLGECVQLLLLLEALSSPPSGTCTCAASRAPATIQDPLSDGEARRLRAMVRKKDEQLAMLYRFHVELARVGGGPESEQQQRRHHPHSSPHARSARGSPSSSHFRDDVSGSIDPLDPAENDVAQHSAFHPTIRLATPPSLPSAAAWSAPSSHGHHHPRSRSVNDAALFAGHASASPPAAPSSAARPVLPPPIQVSKYTKPRTPTGNFAHRHQHKQKQQQPQVSLAASVIAVATERERARKASAGSSASASPLVGEGWYESAESEDEEDAPGHDADADQEGQSNAQNGDEVPCTRHVPLAQARLVFCIREMLADIGAEARA